MPPQITQSAKTDSRHGSITWRGILLILALMFLLGFSAISSRDWRRYLASAHLVEHTYKVLVAAEELRYSIEVAGTSERDYLLTGEERYLMPYRAALSRIIRSQTKLRELTADNPEQHARLSALDRATTVKLPTLYSATKRSKTKHIPFASTPPYEIAVMHPFAMGP